MKYKVSKPTMDGFLLFEYDKSGVLVAFKRESELTPKQWSALAKFFPWDLNLFKLFKDKLGVTAVVIPEDLSFQRFWNAYGLKVGNKKRTEKLWNALDDATRGHILTVSIPNYKAHLRGSSSDQAHASTFLAQERWHNEYI